MFYAFLTILALILLAVALIAAANGLHLFFRIFGTNASNLTSRQIEKTTGSRNEFSDSMRHDLKAQRKSALISMAIFITAVAAAALITMLRNFLITL